jgi:hypothetical protein
MTPLLIVGLVVVIGLMITWTRVGLHRSDRRSMESYGHALDVLGGVAARSDRPARIRVAGHEDATAAQGRADALVEPDVAHVVVEPDVVAERPARGPSKSVAPPKVRLEDVPVEFEDDSDAFERAREVAEAETRVGAPAGAELAGSQLAASEVAAPETAMLETAASEAAAPGALAAAAGPGATPPRDGSPDGGRRHGSPPKAPWSLIGSAAAGLLIVAAIVLAALQLSGGGAPRPHVAGPTTTDARSPSSPSTTVPAPTTLPKTLQPVSATSTDVSFAAPAGSYTVTFTDTTGTCWLGIAQTSGGVYVWQDTLTGGQSTTYKASGPIVIRVGAPPYVKVTVNGIPAQLPGYSQPYDVSFNPATPASSA